MVQAALGIDKFHAKSTSRMQRARRDAAAYEKNEERFEALMGQINRAKQRGAYLSAADLGSEAETAALGLDSLYRVTGKY